MFHVLLQMKQRQDMLVIHRHVCWARQGAMRRRKWRAAEVESMYNGLRCSWGSSSTLCTDPQQSMRALVTLTLTSISLPDHGRPRGVDRRFVHVLKVANSHLWCAEFTNARIRRRWQEAHGHDGCEASGEKRGEEHHRWVLYHLRLGGRLDEAFVSRSWVKGVDEAIVDGE